MDKTTNSARVTWIAKNCKVEGQERGPKHTRVTVSSYLNWDKFLSSNLYYGFHFREKESSITNVRLLTLSVIKYCNINIMMCMLRSYINIYTATMHKKECRSQKGANFSNKRKSRKQNFSWPRAHHNNRPEISRIANWEKRKWVIRSAH